MKVSEYLAATEMMPFQLSELLGHKTTGTVVKKLDDEMPVKWANRLEELEREQNEKIKSEITDAELDDWMSAGREDDKDPNITEPLSGVEVIGPQKIKLSTIQGYIEMVYDGAQALALQRGDTIAAETIERYKPQYIEAWMDYVRYDERLLKYLELFQIGTPLGNLIGIHAISIGAYALARITAKELANIAATNGDVQPEL